MAAVLLVATAAWLVLSVLATGACALIARAGQVEDRRRVDADLARLLDEAAGSARDLPRPRSTVG